ncbi:MAG: SAM-dependent chlorinase/fluorinase [Desulfobacterales bacterium]|nr:SAM-dependent chlorinase/fluorinase [Desulfobacterales bacterium]
MSIITLMTDFGAIDEYVAIMKGTIFSINPSVNIIDITHQIDPQDLIEAAYRIESVYKYFPIDNTIHVIVVDPGVGSDRSIIAVKMFDQIFLAPDNGVLTLLLNKAKTSTIVRVENSKYFLKSISRTFHGRDIFAPVSAHLSKGLPIERLGPTLYENDPVRLSIQYPYISENDELIGYVILIDRFGNLITNIDLECFQKFCRLDMKKTPEVWIGSSKISDLAQNYQSVEPQKPLMIIGSRGYLEIAVNRGNAGSRFKSKKGDCVKVILSKSSIDRRK